MGTGDLGSNQGLHHPCCVLSAWTFLPLLPHFLISEMRGLDQLSRAQFYPFKSLLCNLGVREQSCPAGDRVTTSVDIFGGCD